MGTGAGSRTINAAGVRAIAQKTKRHYGEIGGVGWPKSTCGFPFGASLARGRKRRGDMACGGWRWCFVHLAVSVHSNFSGGRRDASEVLVIGNRCCILRGRYFPVA